MSGGLKCFALTSRAFLPVCRVGISPQLVTRSFSSTPATLAKISSPGKKKRRKRAKVREINPEAMPIVEAARVLQSVEVGRPLSAYELHIKTQFTRGQAPLRGRIALPRDPRTRGETVLVFAEGKAAQDAREAGAAHVGGEELIPKVLDGTLKPTKVICTPSLIGPITPKLARFLGPKGLMPVAKRGTVTEDVIAAVREAKGMLEWKGDKFGYVRAAVGRIHFPVDDVENNVRTFLQTVRDAMTPEDQVFATRKKASESHSFTRRRPCDKF
ncbi:50S ribosomal protein L1 [Thermus thermophilus HB8] [Rhizoctonia solani]|uniref:Ribosomal protein n=1 Tax=Rhizoctonia solani TaxID=456999 RepID=A0A0K6GCD3_9AGAM|nr:50S ribosomal protein L1 [Thermus thermophilus HB8] [Rhizoctonia solani]